MSAIPAPRYDSVFFEGVAALDELAHEDSWPEQVVLVTVDCADCGEPISIGSWPFCRSAINPQGHERGCYGWHFGGR